MMKSITLPLYLLLVTSLVACKAKNLNQSNFKSIDIATAKSLLSDRSDIILLDVRTPQEVAEGHIQGAQNIDVRNDDFVNNISKLDKTKTYLVYCRSGSRSMKASEIMLENGFTDIINMEGGYTSWE